MTFTYKTLALSVTAITAMGVAGLAQAEYPENDITYIIPFDPGGESDVTARFQEPVLEEVLGVSVNVTHRPGGGGAVAWSEFQNSAEPDGYEIIGVNIPHIIGQPIQRNDAGYTTDDWRIVTFFHSTPNALIVSDDSPYDTLEDLIEDAKENPEAITLGGSGTYSANHLDMLRFEQQADIDLTYIPFSGTGPLKGALEGGHVAGIFNYTMLGTEMADSVKVLAVAAEERVKALPDAPTFKEQGYDIVGGAYRGVAVPKDTPDDVVTTLEEAFAEANRQITERQEPLGFVMEYITGDEVDEVMAMLREAYGPILEEAE